MMLIVLHRNQRNKAQNENCEDFILELYKVITDHKMLKPFLSMNAKGLDNFFRQLNSFYLMNLVPLVCVMLNS